jgi:hypothetical protein
MGSRLAFTAGHFELALDKAKTSAYLKSLEGGYMGHSLVDEAIGSDNKRIKHSAVADVEPISFEMGMSGAKSVLQWIQSSWNKDYRPQSGQINHANFNMETVYEHEFSDALITETTFPALDGSSKEAAYLKVKFQPEKVVSKKANGARISPVGGARQKMWLCNAFRLVIDGIDDAVYTNKIDSFTIKQSVKKFFTGMRREIELAPTKLEFPNLSCTIALEKADGILSWYEKYIVKGQQDPRAQRSGAIEFLAPNRNTVLFRIKLDQIGLLKAHMMPSTANSDQIKRVKYELYVSEMNLDLSDSAGLD